MTFDIELTERAAALLDQAKARNWMVATAESCTGGLIAGLLTEIAGSSAVVDRGFVTYSNQAKMDLLGIPEDMLASHGAVSEPVARAMAAGALMRAPAVTLAIAVTGIAGPGGGTSDKPVGLVHLCAAMRGGAARHARVIFPGDRTAIRLATVAMALTLLGDFLAE